MDNINDETCKRMLKDIMILNGASNIKNMGIALFSLLSSVARHIQDEDYIIPDDDSYHQEKWCYSRVFLEIENKDDLKLLYKYIHMKAHISILMLKLGGEIMNIRERNDEVCESIEKDSVNENQYLYTMNAFKHMLDITDYIKNNSA